MHFIICLAVDNKPFLKTFTKYSVLFTIEKCLKNVEFSIRPGMIINAKKIQANYTFELVSPVEKQERESVRQISDFSTTELRVRVMPYIP